MRLRPPSVSLALLSLALLSGCGHLRRPAQTLVISSPYLPSAYQCQRAPAVPGEQASDTDLAVFIAQLWGAWSDCYDQLVAVGEDMERWSQKNIPTQK